MIRNRKDCGRPSGSALGNCTRIYNNGRVCCPRMPAPSITRTGRRKSLQQFCHGIVQFDRCRNFGARERSQHVIRIDHIMSQCMARLIFFDKQAQNTITKACVFLVGPISLIVWVFPVPGFLPKLQSKLKPRTLSGLPKCSSAMIQSFFGMPISCKNRYPERVPSFLPSACQSEKSFYFLS